MITKRSGERQIRGMGLIDTNCMYKKKNNKNILYTQGIIAIILKWPIMEYNWEEMESLCYTPEINIVL